MVDPRESDPKFPERPTHEDFILLSEIIQEIDKRSDTEDVITIMDIDEESIFYFLANRMRIYGARLGRPLSDNMVTLLSASWSDGFAAGREFEKRKPK